MILKRKLIFVSLFLLIIVGGFWFILKEEETDNETTRGISQIENKAVDKAVDIKYQPNKAGNQNCPAKIEEKTVRGDSLAGLIEDGQMIKVLFGYYDCQNIKRKDVVLYSFAGNEAPLIKIIKGMPGDKFNLQKTEGGWHILINDEILKNSENIPYLIDGKRYEMLALYEKDYQDKIPEAAYLILGNIPTGAVDSTYFGLVSKKDILAKVEY